MPAKIQQKESRDITLRFIRSYEELRYRGLVTTKKEFCEIVGIGVSSNLKRMEDSETYEPTLTQVALLVTKFNVSPNWLLLGKGDFLSKTLK
ncbi:hypothetical protein [Bacteroides sp.]|jgi:hypothetical protein|uniref:hypothetical protein n=1 Tax=Bacteroides sp. TaxID=29523 RepID=UPI003D14E33A